MQSFLLAIKAPGIRLVTGCFLLSPLSLWGAAGGSISGTVSDKSEAVVHGATLKLVDAARHTIYKAFSDSQGRYAFRNLPVGHYELTTKVRCPSITS